MENIAEVEEINLKYALTCDTQEGQKKAGGCHVTFQCPS